MSHPTVTAEFVVGAEAVARRVKDRAVFFDPSRNLEKRKERNETPIHLCPEKLVYHGLRTYVYIIGF